MPNGGRGAEKPQACVGAMFVNLSVTGCLLRCLDLVVGPHARESCLFVNHLWLLISLGVESLYALRSEGRCEAAPERRGDSLTGIEIVLGGMMELPCLPEVPFPAP